MIEGNYWLDLIRFEKDIKLNIEKVVKRFLGKRRYSNMKEDIIYMVSRHLDVVSKMKNLSNFQVDYDLSMDFHGDVFVDFKVINVSLM